MSVTSGGGGRSSVSANGGAERTLVLHALKAVGTQPSRGSVVCV